MEALACGTPVIAFPVGALPESVEHGRTGLLVQNVPQMADALHSVTALDRTLCRARARERFRADRMTGAYLSLYRRLAACTR
jgi:glycosyltransferase involved in cell wall biosynthesis